MRLGFIVTSLLGALSAQTYVVDASGGGQFTDLQTAVATVPSGSVLRVRGGAYSPFSFANKSLTIIGDSATTVFVRAFASTPLVIRPTAAQYTVVLKNLCFQGSVDIPALHVQLRGLAGPAYLEDVTIGWPAGSGLAQGAYATFADSANVHCLRCTLVATSAGGPALPVLSTSNASVELVACVLKGVDFNTIGPPGGGAVLATASRLTAIGCAITGGRGAQFNLSTAKSQPGGTALDLQAASVLHASGAGSSATGYPGGDGGAGIVLTGSAVVLVGVTPVGGAAGVGSSPGQPGAAIVSGPGSSVRSVAATGPSLALSGNLTPGGLASVDLSANAGDWTTLLIGQTPLYANAPFWLPLGTLFVDPQLAFGAFQVPASGRLAIPLPLVKS